MSAFQGLFRAPKTFNALRIPGYRFLWLSTLAAASGFMMQTFARGLLAYQLAGTAAAISVVTVSLAFPQLAFSLIGGITADRMDRRKVMIGTQTSHALLALTLSILVYTDEITLTYLFITGVLQGAVISFNQPARQALIAEVVGQKDFMNALALNNAGQNLCRIGAPSLAGALVAVPWIGIGGAFFIPAMLNLVSLILIFFMPRASTAVEGGATPPRRKRPGGLGAMSKDLRDGLSYIRRSPILVTLLALGLVPMFLGGSFQSFMPIWAKDVFGDGVHSNPAGLGLLGTAAGVGAVFGSLAVATLAEYKRRALLQLCTGIGFGLLLTAFAIQSNFVVALVVLAGVGFMTSFFQASNSTMIVGATDPEYYGRVVSVNFLTTSLAPIGTVIMGFLIDGIGVVELASFELFGVQVVYAATGLLVTAFILAVTAFNPTYRRLERDDLTEFARKSSEPTLVGPGDSDSTNFAAIERRCFERGTIHDEPIVAINPLLKAGD